MTAAPATRLLALLELLQTRRQCSGAELATALDIDRRTVRRYIAQLEALGVPLIASRGRDGGYGLVPGFKLPPMMFSNDEALALTLGLLMARGLGLAESAPAIASAQAKLERVMPAALRAQARAVDETVKVDANTRTVLRDNRALSTLSTAARAQQRVRLHYRSAVGEDSRRDFDPYGLALRAGRWYVSGYCHLRQGLRSFRLDRITAVETLPASFLRPPGFDALVHLTESLANMPRSQRAEILLHASLEDARCCLFPELGVFEPTDEGTRLSVQVDDLDWLARELARLPFGFRVIAPEGLSEALHRHAIRLLAASGAPAR
jgi:predicted DNA-binding transcriptional regulator YafY